MVTILACGVSLAADRGALELAVADLHRPGAILVFEGAKPVRGHRRHALKVPLPEQDGALASRVAAAAGADGAVWSDGTGDWVSPATPLLDQLLGVPIGPVRSARGVGAWAAALAQADRALSAGDPSAALHAIERSHALAPADAAPCDTVGAVRFLEWRVARLAGVDSDALEAMEATCTGRDVPADQQPMARVLAAWVFLDDKAAGSALPDDWATPERRVAWLDALSAQDLPPTPLARLRAATVARLADHEPAERCDAGAPERRREARRDAAAQLRDLGDHERAWVVELGHLTALDGTLDLDAVDRMLVDLEDPAQRWLRGSVLRRSLEHAPLGRAPDVPTVRRWCDAAVAAMGDTAAIERGTVRPSRDVTRISAALAGAMRCPEPEPYVALVDTLIGARLAAPDGHVGLMEVGALIGLQIVGDLLSGGEGVGQRTALMRDRLVVARDALGDSPDDRVLGAVLSVAIASIGELLGDAKELGAALASSRAVFDAVADDGVSTGAARFAPALHLATATVEAAWHARGDDDAARDGVLAVIDANGERDVTRSLAVWGAEVYTDAVLRLIRGARQLLSAEDAALDAVAAASQPGPEERGEWRVGLEISRVLLWDVASSRPGGGGALDEADVVLRRLVTAALDEWDLRHTGWEMLELVPALHHASMRMLLEGSDADAERLADELGAVVSEGLARMSPELRDGDAAALGVLAVGRDALLTADTEGMSEIVASPEARQRWLLALAARSEAYTPELRFLTRALVGRAIAEPDLASGLAWLEHASADADDPRVSEVRYGLDLLRAAALASDPARHPDALEALDAALSVGAETAACGIVHEVEAMRPVRAWLLAQGGRHDEADAELATYLAAAAAGGPTEGVLRCEITAKQPGVSVNLTVEHGLQSIVLAHLDEGSLSIGAGHESSARPLTSTTCSSRPAPAFRHDVVLRAALLRAVLRMRADRDAGAALSDAVRLVARLRTGSEFTLPPALAAGLETSRDAAPVELLAWTSAMAFAHGHVSSAELLRGAARAWTDDPALQVASTPMELRGLGLDDRAPLVAAWLGADAEQGPDRLRQALAAAPGVRPDVVPVAMARLQREPDLAGLRAPGSALWAAQLAGMQRLAAMAPQPIDPRADAAAIEALARVGAFTEAAQLSIDIAAEHAAGRRLPEAIVALQQGRRAVPSEVAPHASTGLLLREGAAQPNLEWALAVAAVFPSIAGTLEAEEQLSLGLSAATVLVGTDRYASLDTLASHLQEMSARGIDRSEPISANIEWLALAAAAATGRIDGPALERARARIAAEPQAPLVVHDLVDALTTLVDRPPERAEAARAFLRSIAPE